MLPFKTTEPSYSVPVYYNKNNDVYAYTTDSGTDFYKTLKEVKQEIHIPEMEDYLKPYRKIDHTQIDCDTTAEELDVIKTEQNNLAIDKEKALRQAINIILLPMPEDLLLIYRMKTEKVPLSIKTVHAAIRNKINCRFVYKDTVFVCKVQYSAERLSVHLEGSNLENSTPVNKHLLHRIQETPKCVVDTDSLALLEKIQKKCEYLIEDQKYANT